MHRQVPAKPARPVAVQQGRQVRQTGLSAHVSGNPDKAPGPRNQDLAAQAKTVSFCCKHAIFFTHKPQRGTGALLATNLLHEFFSGHPE
jgi:hypothetical protein